MQRELPCDHLWDRLSAYVDGELTPAEALEVELHAAACPGCARALAFMAGVAETLGSAPEAAPPPGLRERILAATVARPRLTDRVADLFGPLQAPARGWALAGAAVACLALGWVTTTTLPTALLGPLKPGPSPRREAPPVAAAPADPADPANRLAAAPPAAGPDRHKASAAPQRPAPRAEPMTAAAAPRGRTAAAPSAARVASAAGPHSTPRVRPALGPERAVTPDVPRTVHEPVIGPPARSEPAPALPPSIAPAARNDAPRPSGDYVLTAAAPSSGAHVATMAELRQTLSRPGNAARNLDFVASDDRELTVNLVQSRF